MVARRPDHSLVLLYYYSDTTFGHFASSADGHFLVFIADDEPAGFGMPPHPEPPYELEDLGLGFAHYTSIKEKGLT